MTGWSLVILTLPDRAPQAWALTPSLEGLGYLWYVARLRRTGRRSGVAIVSGVWHAGGVSEGSTSIAAEVLKAARGGQAVAVATVITAPPGGLAAGLKLLLRVDGSMVGSLGGGALEEAVVEDASNALNRTPREAVQAIYYRAEGERVHRLEAGQGDDAYEVMIEVVEAPVTLLIVGGGHIGLSLATIAAHVGFSVAVLDDRALFANAERFPMADKVMSGDFHEHLSSFPIGQSTYIVLVSRGHKQDETGLREVVTRGAAYVGMIGSKRRVSTVLRHLAEEGYPLEALERVYTPVGFDIGAETPEEIAVSIMAEIIAVRRGGKGGAMRDQRPSIRAGEMATESE
ncbi:MAG: xanthine dehydrogenase [Dehalococcoidia bacterium]|nr:xanthine dehydrogenase [Dehalococcoidia bacterium]